MVLSAGGNDYGQLGRGFALDPAERSSPTPVRRWLDSEEKPGVTWIGCGYYTSNAIDSSSALFQWGQVPTTLLTLSPLTLIITPTQMEVLDHSEALPVQVEGKGLFDHGKGAFVITVENLHPLPPPPAALHHF